MRWAWMLPLLFAADQESESARLLRVAWASQYEWNEDGVKSVTLDFRYKLSRRLPQGATDEFDGRAEFVVVDGQVVRRHFRGLSKARRGEVSNHVDWVLARFQRRPFEEQFKGATFPPPEEGTDGRKTIGIGTTSAYHLKQDRIVGAEYRANEQAPWVPVAYVTADVRGGYAIVGESWASLADGQKTDSSRKLHLAAESEFPAPLRYVYALEAPGVMETFTIDFSPARFNEPEPVVLDPSARDLIKAAWEKRHGLPETLKLTGEFLFKPDPKAWNYGTDRCEGEFQVWGMDKIDAHAKDAPASRGAGGGFRRDLADDFRWLFELLRARPFDQAFAGCGFRATPGDKFTIVYVLGLENVLAYRVAEGRIVAHLDNTPEEDAWWEHKARKLPDGLYLLEKLVRKVGDRTYEQTIRYSKTKGLYLPKEFGKFRTDWGARGTTLAIDEYELRNVKVVE